MEIVIITGMSGAGKSSALNILEDLGYYCMDNLPKELIIEFAKLNSKSEAEIKKLAVGVDIRGLGFGQMVEEIDKLEDLGHRVDILFLDCEDEVLVKRYKEKRRPHPMDRTGNLLKGISDEREILARVKTKADHIIDTSNLILADLKDRISKIYGADAKSNMLITVVSFGFKHGILLDADLVFDVRFLPNPHYIEPLRSQTGKDAPVYDFIFSHEESHEFLDKLMDLLNFTIPYYDQEGKPHLTIGIGCTGGKHRSVALAEKIGQALKENNDLVFVNHRDERYW